MAKLRVGKASDSEYLDKWKRFVDNFKNATPVDMSESVVDKRRRIARLEASPEEWFKYYFPNFCTAQPADFHLRATRRLLSHPEWFEVRAWSRELAKSARSMMEFCYLALTGHVHNLLLVSNSHDNAVNLLLPFKAFFEANNRVINDYGAQVSYGAWQSHKFVISAGCSFRAIGWGESPRGTRNNEKRPDAIIIDDFDTDEDCRNEEVMVNKINWIEQALIPTRSISGNLRIVVNGNIIHNNCAVKYMGENIADHFDVVNIRDKDGKSSWPSKNSEEAIDRVLSTISYKSAQKEYFNNPMDGGDTFKDILYGRIPPLHQCRCLIYADPATSNKDRSNASYKAVGLLAYKDGCYYIVRCACDTMSNSAFVDYLFEFYTYATEALRGESLRVYIENNTLQDPFYEQVLLPLIYKRSEALNVSLPVCPDTRKKPEKWQRIEALLEPLNRLGHLVFNEHEKDNDHMKRLVAQFTSASPKARRLDGPDMVEGGVFILRNSINLAGAPIINVKRKNKFKL